MQANRLLIPGARVEGRTSQLCLLVSSCGNVILQGSRTRLKQAGSVRNPPRSFLGRTLPTFFVHGRDTDSQTPANEKGLPAISRKPFLFSMMKWLRGLDLNQRPPGYEHERFNLNAVESIASCSKMQPKCSFCQSNCNSELGLSSSEVCQLIRSSWLSKTVVGFAVQWPRGTVVTRRASW